MFKEKVLDLKNSKVKCCDSEKELSYSEIYDKATNIKRLLNDLAIKGDRIIIFMDNSLEVIVSLIAILSCDMVCVPISINSPNQIIEEKMHIVNSKVVLCDNNSMDKLININHDFGIINVSSNKITKLYSNHISEGNNNSSSKEFLILFTSGTTAKYKAVVHTEYSIMSNIDSVFEYMKLDKNDICFISKEYYHCSTLICEILLCIVNNISMFISSTKLQFIKNLNIASNKHCTVLFLNPTLLRIVCLINSSITYDSFNLIISSGDVLNSEVYDTVQDIFPNAELLNVYGLTEAGPRICAQRRNRKCSKGSVGYPIKGVSLKLCIEKNIEQKIKSPIGELLIKSNSIMLGYLNDPKSTSLKITNGWLRTGDLAFITPEHEVFIIGRKDDMIIRNSRNINPNYIENELIKHPDINDLIVFGFDDKIYGKKIICMYDSKITLKESELYEFCKTRLEKFEFPQEFIKCNTIPKNLIGKKSRERARQIYAEKYQCHYSN